MKSIKIRTPDLLTEGFYLLDIVHFSNKPVLFTEYSNVEIDFNYKNIIGRFKILLQKSIYDLFYNPEIFTAYWYFKELKFIKLLKDKYLREATIQVYLKSENSDVNNYFTNTPVRHELQKNKKF